MNELNLFLIENKNKKKNNDVELIEKLKSVKHTLKDCLDFIIDKEDIQEQDDDFFRSELKNLLKSYININIQLNRKNEKNLLVKSIIDNLIDKVVYTTENNKNINNFEKEIKLIKKERNKNIDTIIITKSIN